MFNWNEFLAFAMRRTWFGIKLRAHVNFRFKHKFYASIDRSTAHSIFNSDIFSRALRQTTYNHKRVTACLGSDIKTAEQKKNKHIFFDSVNWIVIPNTTLKFPLNLLNIGGFHRIGEKTLIYATMLTIANREKKNTESEWSGRTLLNSEIITHRMKKKNVTLIWMAIFNSKKCKSIAYQMCENNVSILMLNSFAFF